MHAVAESGVASHWAYKSGDTHEDETTLRTNQWLQNILDLQSRSDNAFEFLEHIKVDLFPNEVYIVTPKAKSSHCHAAQALLTLPMPFTPTLAKSIVLAPRGSVMILPLGVTI